MTKHISHAELAEILQRHDIEQALEQLLQATLKAGATDNTTLMPIRCVSESAA